jgi:hypothetical protein
MKFRLVGIVPLVAFLCIIGCMTQTAQAQTNFREFEFDSTKTYVVELIDGSEFTGKYVGKTNDVLIMSTSSIPRIEIPFSQIKSITVAETSSMRGSKYWFPNPNATRYFFAPSGFNLKKGEGYYQNSYLILNSVNYGLTNNFSIGGSIELISTFSSLANGSFNPIILITPKFAYPVANNVNLGAGLLFLSIPSIDDEPRTGAGIAYGIGTYGNIEHNATLGLGWGFIDGYWANRPVITLNGMTRVRPNMSLVTENWIIPFGDDLEEGNYYGVYSYGVRFFGKKLSVDLAFINNRDIAEVLLIGIPYVDFVVKF